jgi:RNA polymerase sigma factor (TIGR02999 family)
MPASKDISQLLAERRAGHRSVESELIRLVYPQLRRLARHYMKRERRNHTLQSTALVHEAYMRMMGEKKPVWQDRAHFFALAATQMRRILVDHARAANAQRRGAGCLKLSLTAVSGISEPRDESLLALDEALDRLQALDARASQVIELRFFGGLTEKETAEVLGISATSVRRTWDFARVWLFEQLSTAASEPPIRKP